MSPVNHYDTASSIEDTMRRIDHALDHRDQDDFLLACRQRDRLLTTVIETLETSAFVLFR